MNNRGKYIYKAYLTGEIALNNAKSKLESTMSDKWLTEEEVYYERQVAHRGGGVTMKTTAGQTITSKRQ